MKRVRWFRNAAYGGGWEFNLVGRVWCFRIARHQIALWKNYKPIFNMLDTEVPAGRGLSAA